ncbi:MAG: MFS transporter [Dehalococcoidia bacterium]|nr:MFS transporter [Dehalococcoidia bacterium]
MSRPVAATTPAAVAPSGVALLLALSALGAVIAPLNSTMIAVALPEIRREFGLSHALAGWLISGYLIAMAVTQPVGGSLGDQVGRERVLRWGLVGCLVFSLGAMAAPTFAVLVSFRIAQAVAAAVLIPNGIALLRTAAPPEQLGRLYGINGSILSAAAAGGPLLGAGALALGSWRLIFLLNVPLVLLTLLLLARLRLPDMPRTTGATLDGIGSLLFVALLTAVTLQLSSLRDGASVATVAGWIVTLAIGVLFVLRQRTTTRPAVEWALFRSRSYGAATGWILLTNLTMYTVLLMVPFFIRDVQGKSTQLSGLLLGAMSVLVALASPLGGRLSDVLGRRPLMLAGAAVALAGSLALLASLRTDTPAPLLAACLGVLGVGLGLGTGPAISAALEAAPVAAAGAASGTSSMMRYTGSIVGAGLLAGVLSNGGGAAGEIITFRVVTVAVVVTAGAAVVAALFVHRFAEDSTQQGIGIARRDRWSGAVIEAADEP